MVAFLPSVTEAYDTLLSMNKILTSFLWCGLRLRAFCKAFCGRGYAPHPFLQGFSLPRREFDHSAPWTKRKKINSGQSYRAAATCYVNVL